MDLKQIGSGQNSKTKTTIKSNCLSNSQGRLTVDESKLLTCDICHFSTVAKELLRRHLLVHKLENVMKTYRCSLCSFESKYSKTFRFHMFSKHDDTSNANIISCELCGFKTIQKNMLKRHMIVHNEAKLKCTLCSFETKNKQTLQGHVVLKHGMSCADVITCELCGYKTLETADLEKHLKKHSEESHASKSSALKTESLLSYMGENVTLETSNLSVREKSQVKIHKCSYTHCNFESKTSKGLRCHLSLKHGDTPKILTCESCNFKTLRPNHLKVHTMKHVVEKSFKCGCGYETKYEKSLQKHMLLRHKSDDGKILKCELCDFKCLHPSILRGHMVKHGVKSGTKVHKCECGYETKYSARFRNHLVLRHGHDDPKVVKCPICGYRCLNPSVMKTHVIAHSNKIKVEKFTCQLCEFVTKYRKNLKGHMVLKHGETSANLRECNICQYKTMYKKDLKRHMMIHMDKSEVKFYKCEFCDLESKYKNNMQTHVALRHGHVSQT